MGSISKSKSNSTSNSNMGGMGGMGGAFGVRPQSFQQGYANQQQMAGDQENTLMGLMNAMKGAADQTQASNPMMAMMTNMFGTPQQQEQVSEVPAPMFEQPATPVEQTPQPVAQDSGWGGVKNNQDAIAWSLQNGDISPEEAQWLGKWSQESGHKGDMFTNGGWMNWDHNNSGLTGQNKAIVGKFKNSLSGNYGDAPAAPAQQAAYTPNKFLGGRRRGARGGM